MRRRSFQNVEALTVLGALLLASACSSGSSSAPPGNNDNPGTGGEITLPTPNPRAVSLVLDAATAVTVVVPASGGTVTAVATDGTGYALEIPPDALTTARTIRLTPVSSVPGLPLSAGLHGAVQLEPQGLAFLKEATLRITPLDPIDATSLVGFTYAGTGAEFHLVPATLAGGQISVKVWHFSGAGAGGATDLDLTAAAGSPPTDPGDQVDQLANDLLARGRAAGNGLTPEILAEVAKLYKAWWKASVWPKLQAAETNETLLRAAARQFVRWDRDLSLLGIRDGYLGNPSGFQAEHTAGWASLRRSFKFAIDQAVVHCFSDKDPREGRVITALGRESTLLGIESYTFDQISTKANRCLRFEVAVTSATTCDYPAAFSAGATGTFFIRRNLDAGAPRINGTGSITIDSGTPMVGLNQSLVLVPTPVAVEVAQTFWMQDPPTATDDESEPPVVLDQLDFKVACPASESWTLNGVPLMTTYYWGNAWWSAHHDLFVGLAPPPDTTDACASVGPAYCYDGIFVMSGWTVTPVPWVASKTYAASGPKREADWACGTSVCQDAMTITVTHKPLQ
jgi:hypothetical protein